MITQDQLHDVIGSTAYDSGSDKIGKVGAVYYDDTTDQPKWLTVHTGFFGSNETFVPVEGADLVDDGRVTVAYAKATVKDAPNVSENGHLSVEEEQHLYRHYQRDGADAGVAGAMDGRHADTAPTGAPASDPNTDTTMTRSEEQLRVGTETRETGRARLRKHVVTENVTTTVPVSHEEVTLQREPITEADRADALSGGDLTEDEREVTLHEERVVTAKETVPVERVRLGTETVTGHEQVDETVRKEVLDTDGVEDTRDRR